MLKDSNVRYALENAVISVVGVMVAIFSAIISCLYLPIAFLLPPARLPDHIASPKNVCVTGAGSGLGRAFAIRYSRPGATLFLTDLNHAGLMETCKMCCELGATVIRSPEGIDVCNYSKLESWVNTWIENHDLDLVIANAGVAGPNLPRDFTCEQRIAKCMEVNVMGVTNTMQAVLPKMKREQKGQIAIVASLAAFGWLPQWASYMASKSAVYRLGMQMRVLLQSQGVRINVVCPGFAQTGMTKPLEGKKTMPFMVSAESMVDKIVMELGRDTPLIMHPFPTALVSVAATFVPPALLVWASERLLCVPGKIIDRSG
eukprot:Nk52_evm1s10 gene=Nk52_evmTU1s10